MASNFRGALRPDDSEIGKRSLGTKLGHPGARVYCYPPTPMGKLAFGILSPT